DPVRAVPARRVAVLPRGPCRHARPDRRGVRSWREPRRGDERIGGMGMEKNSHCSYCGAGFADDAPWPRRCASCGNASYLNPLPVAVLLQPVDDGLLAIRRALPPVGRLALPGGYVDAGETWQAAAARELREGTGPSADP